MNFPPRAIVDRIKKDYPQGTRVRLLHMEDPYRNMREGMKGTVNSVDDTGTIHVDWDEGGCLGVVYGEDSCEKLHTVTVRCYGKEDTFDCRKDAVDFYTRALLGSEGSEHERYSNVLTDLMLGKDYATDGVE